MKTIASLLLFAALASAQTTTFQLHGVASELVGTTNGSAVTPAIGPAGTLVVNGAGAVAFTPVAALPPGTAAASGVSFKSCCANTNNAFYKFTGAGLGSIFNAAEGQVVLYLTSPYTFAQLSTLTGFRYAFDVQDVQGSHQLGFVPQVTSGKLLYTYWTGGKTSAQYF